MKSILFIISNLLIFPFVIVAQQKNKHALLIAIGEYAEYQHEGFIPWGQLHSENDITFIENVLNNQGFDKNNVTVLLNKKATKENILKTFHKNIINRVNEGDIVFLFFSGHGQQFQDINGDEVDGYDESLAPYDAQQRYIDNIYQGKNHIIDDEIGDLLNILGERLGQDGHILFIVDACYSGTISRHETIHSKGSAYIMAPESYIKYVKKSEIHKNPHLDELVFQTTKNIASLVVITATKQNEKCFEILTTEGKYAGPLSYAFSKVFSNITQPTTYREAFEQIKLNMSGTSPNQSPQINGEIDAKVFSGEILPQQQWFKINAIINDSTCIINTGNLNGIYEGTLAGIYPFYASDISSVVAILCGSIINSKELCSVLLLDNNTKFHKSFDFSKHKIMIKSYGLKPIEKTLFIDINNKHVKKKMKELLENTKGIKLTNNTGELRLTDANSKLYSLITICSDTLFSIPINQINCLNLAEHIKYGTLQYARAIFFRELDLKNPIFESAMEIVPIIYNVRNGYVTDIVECNIEEKRDKFGNIFLKDGDGFKIKIINKSYETLYFNILSIQPDHKISILLPDSNYDIEELKLNPQSSFIFDKTLLKFSGPYGKDVFKLIASTKKFDLRFIHSGKNAKRRTNSEFEKMLQNHIFMENKRSHSENHSNNEPDIYVSTIIVNVTKK